MAGLKKKGINQIIVEHEWLNMARLLLKVFFKQFVPECNKTSLTFLTVIVREQYLYN